MPRLPTVMATRPPRRTRTASWLVRMTRATSPATSLELRLVEISADACNQGEVHRCRAGK